MSSGGDSRAAEPRYCRERSELSGVTVHCSRVLNYYDKGHRKRHAAYLHGTGAVRYFRVHFVEEDE